MQFQLYVLKDRSGLRGSPRRLQVYMNGRLIEVEIAMLQRQPLCSLLAESSVQRGFLR